MPELPEVQTVVQSLRPGLVGRRIARVEVLRPDVIRPPGFDLQRSAAGCTIQSVERRGKRIVLRLGAGGEQLFIHLGMTGRLTLEAADAERAKHTHVVFHLSGRGAATLRFCDPRRFGGIWWIGTDDPGGRMGPEPLSLRAAQLARRLRGTRRAIKTALLDQAVVAGMGNIYADEALFAAGIHPQTPAGLLDAKAVSELNRMMKLTLRRAIRHGGSTLRDYVDANGKAGRYQQRHRVYGRDGEPCVRCRSEIVRIVLGGRSTHFCPTCQKSKGLS